MHGLIKCYFSTSRWISSLKITGDALMCAWWTLNFLVWWHTEIDAIYVLVSCFSILKVRNSVSQIYLNMLTHCHVAVKDILRKSWGLQDILLSRLSAVTYLLSHCSHIRSHLWWHRLNTNTSKNAASGMLTHAEQCVLPCIALTWHTLTKWGQSVSSHRLICKQ